MASPLTATHRIEFQYTVLSFVHKFHAYCSAVTGTGPSGWNITQSDLTTQDFQAVVDAWWNTVKGAFKASDTTLGQAILQVRSGTTWLPISFFTTAVTATGASPTLLAGQMTMTLRDQNAKKLRIILLETIHAAGVKIVTPTGGGGDLSTIGTNYSSGGASGSKNPYNWQLSRNGQSIGSFISQVTDLNNKIRRRRGIA